MPLPSTDYDEVGTKCSGHQQPGTAELARAVMVTRSSIGTDGVYNCRPIRVHGSTTLSFHAEGRAWDAHIYHRADGDWLANFFLTHHADLGVQEIIWWGRRWDVQSNMWRAYRGDDDHHTHVHVSQNWDGARDLTYPRVIELLEEDMSLNDADKDWIKAEMARQFEINLGRVVDVKLDDGKVHKRSQVFDFTRRLVKKLLT